MCGNFLIRRLKGLPVCLLALIGSMSLQAQYRKNINDLVQARLAEGVSFAEADLFEKTTNPLNKRERLEGSVFLNVDRAALGRVYKAQEAGLRMQLPFENGDVLALDLYRVELLTEDFKLTTSDGLEVDYQPGLYYRGVIQGEEQSLVALSLFENEIIATINSEENGQLSLGLLDRSVARSKNTTTDLYVVNRSGDFLTESGFKCFTEEPEDYSASIAGDDLLQTRNLVANCVRMYFECDYPMYQENGSSTTQTTNFLTSIFNGVSTIYANESITITMHQVKVWTSPDPYSDSNASTALNQFSGTSHSADLGHLVARGGSGLGGVAWLDVICSSSNGYGYSNINGSVQPYPNYSWDVGVVTHEIGHNLGSPHTHSCSWSGGALDNCYTTEGGCSPGPSPPSSGGTIMSYCHLTSYGINLAAGFGSQPGNLIRSRVTSASCLSACSTTSGCSGTQTLTTPTGSFDDGSGSGDYNNQQDCSWLIQPGNGAITLSFSSFDTEASYDYVRVYDGSSTSATLLGEFHGTSIPGSVTSTGSVMFVRFTSDQAVTAGGFSASYTTNSTQTGCSGTTTLTAPSGSFTDGSGGGDYENNSDCRWLIQPSGAGSVTLSFSAFATESGYDYVRVYDGSTTSASLLGTFHGSSIPGSLSSSGGSMLVRFTSDAYVTAAGFSASYTSGTSTCTNVTMSITLDNYGSETTWEIKNSAGSVVASGGPYQNNANGQVVSETACLNSGSYTLTIFDSYGDGICCGYGNGSYQLTSGGVVLASGGSFGSSESTSFQIP